MEGRPPGSSERIAIRPTGEITLKAARARRRFQGALRANIADALRARGIAGELEMSGARVVLSTESGEAARAVLSRVFGISSYSVVEATADCDLDAIAARGEAVFADAVRGRSFAVRARRLGPGKDGIGFTSVDVARRLGAALDGYGTVDLGAPEVTVEVEVDATRAVMYSARRPGPGGLPLGIQGRALTLLSGGFDSAVAAWRLMKRGVATDFAFCNLGGGAYERLVLQVAKVLAELWAHGQRPRLFVVDFGPVVEELRERVREAYLQIVLKRQMYGAAERIAVEEGLEVIATGESIGQVSSQTLKNLASIDDSVALPVIRPLVACDKREIVAEAERIGTAPLSARVREYCALTDARPVTATSSGRVAEEAAKLDPAVLDAAAAGRRTFDLKKLDASDLRMPYLFTEEIPDGAVVVDCQPRRMFEARHVPDAVHLDPASFAAGLRNLDRSKSYVVYCAYGTQAPRFVEIMQQAGYEAYAFRGGLGAVRKACETGRSAGRIGSGDSG